MPLNSDLISQEGLLRSGVIRGLERNGQVTRKWPSSPLSYSSLPVVPPLPEISLMITNKYKKVLDGLGRTGMKCSWEKIQGLGTLVALWSSDWSCECLTAALVFPSPQALSPCTWPLHTFSQEIYVLPASGRLCPGIISSLYVTLPLSGYPQYHLLFCH